MTEDKSESTSKKATEEIEKIKSLITRITEKADEMSVFCEKQRIKP
jgi:hypothetical protein